MDIWHQMAKEWYWFVIVGALVAVAFAPSFLKGKCPQCRKRGLVSVDLDQVGQEQLASFGLSFPTLYNCRKCQARLYRERSGELKAADDRFTALFEREPTV